MMPPDAGLPNPPKIGDTDAMDRSITLDERTGTEALIRGLSRMSDMNLEDLEVSVLKSKGSYSVIHFPVLGI